MNDCDRFMYGCVVSDIVFTYNNRYENTRVIEIDYKIGDDYGFMRVIDFEGNKQSYYLIDIKTYLQYFSSFFPPQSVDLEE